MTKQVINVGTTANDKKGDSLRIAFQKVNTNFTELYTALGLSADVNLNIGAFEFAGSVMTTTDSTAIVIDQATTITSDLTVGGDILPSRNLQTTLGSPTHKFHSIYVGTGSVYIGDAKLSLDGGKISSSVGFDLTDSVGGGGGSSVTTGDTAPTSPDVGDLWYDSVSGRTYVYYDDSWVDASPVDGVGISETNELVNGDYTVSLGTDGLVSVTGAIGWGLDENSPTLTDATINKVGDNLEIKTNLNLNPYTWSFSNLSKLTLPSGAVIDTYADGAENSTYFWGGNGQVIAVRGMNAENVYGGGIDIKPDGSVDIIAQDETSATWTFTQDGNLAIPDRITFSDNSWQSTAFVGHAYSLKNNPTGSLYVTLDDSGTINTPLLLPLTFTAVLNPAHYVGEGTLILEGDAWEFEVQFQVGVDGTVQTMIGNDTPWVSNPGYIDDLEFEFVEADHGIPGYTFTLGLYDVVQAGPAGWSTNLTASIPPEYPSTIKSLGAIKLTTTGSTVVPGQEIVASDAQGGITNDYITVWVEGGGTNYPEIVAVQPGWTVVGEGLNHVSVTNTELITQFPGSVIYRITTTISSAKMGYEYTFIGPDGSEPDLQNWVFGTDGQLTVPGSIFRDGGLYMNSSGSTTAASVFVSGFSGSVILRTANNADQLSYDLTLDVDGETTFPGRLNFSDGSTLGDNILTGAIDSDLGLEVKRTITVSDVAAAGSTTGTLIVDISENDDITVVAPGWEINAGSEIAPQWMTVTVIAFNPDNTAIEITVDGFEFEPGNTYTFKNPTPESNIWVIRSQTGGILGPGGAIITNETADLGEGLTYRELAIELPTPDGLNEQRWVFDNDGTLESPVGGTINTSRLDADHLNASYINYQTNDPIQIGAGNGSRFTVNMGRFQVLADVPLTSVGSDGDVVGCVAFDASYIYYCTGLYNGVSNIWKRVAFDATPW